VVVTQVRIQADSIQILFLEKDNEREKKKNENVNEHDTQLRYINNTIIEMSREMEKPRQIFLPPLSEKIFDETKWRY